MDMRQLKAIEKENKGRILTLCPTVTEDSGIYFFTREENGFKYAYVGQAKHLLSRLAGHLRGYQHIDLSLRKHGLWREDKPEGWKVAYLKFPEAQLDEKEQYYIRLFAEKGYQLYNKTSGSQSEGKQGIFENKPSKGYYDGLEQGKKNTRRWIANLFEKHLDYKPKSDKPNKNQEKAMQKFKDFLTDE